MKVSVCAIMRDEGPYVREWVAVYQLLGFDEIIIYDNHSAPESRAVLDDLAARGQIILRTQDDGEDFVPQFIAYKRCLNKTDADWLLFVDADEFLFLEDNLTVHQFLERFDDTVALVGINWSIVGSNGEKSYRNELLSTRFTRRAEDSHRINGHLKSFIRPGRVLKINIHTSEVDGRRVHASGEDIIMRLAPDTGIPRIGISDMPDFRGARLYHYVVKSEEEYIRKRDRGRANRRGDDPLKMTLLKNKKNYFRNHDRNEVEDLTMANRAPLIEAAIERQKAAPTKSARKKNARQPKASLWKRIWSSKKVLMKK